MGKLRKLIFISSIFTALVLFIFGIYLLNSINNNKDGSKFSDFLNLDEYKPLKEPVNVLVTGADVAVNSGDPIRTDTIMIVNYNPKNSQMNILSIPRDTRIDYNGNIAKINSVYANGGGENDGCLALEKSIGELIGIDIDYYVLIKTDVFRDVIDELGGIKYNVPCDLYYNDPQQNLEISVKKGEQKLDGEKAEGVMRFRHPQRDLYLSDKSFNEVSKYYNGSDLNRIDAQHKFIKEVIKQKASLSSLSKVQEILGIVFDKLETDFQLETVIKIGSNLKDLSKNNVRTFKIAVVDVESDVEFTNKIIDNSNKKEYSANEIINKYFSTGNEVKVEKNKDDEKDKEDKEYDSKSEIKSEITVKPESETYNSNNQNTPNPVSTIKKTSAPTVAPTVLPVKTNTPIVTVNPTPVPTIVNTPEPTTEGGTN
ncbi:MAG: LCP family protein [Clostridiales bacterium]